MVNLLKLYFVIVVLIAAVSSANASQLFTDNWNDGSLYGPTYSPNGTDWVLEQGSYSVNSGCLSDYNSGPSRISIDFGLTVENTPVEVRFKLYNVWESQAFYRFVFGLKNTVTGYYLEEHSSPNGTLNEGVCGFSNMMQTGSGPGDWYIGKGDVNSAALSHIGGEWNYLKLKFDPATGVEVWQAKSSNRNLAYDDSSLAYSRVAHWSNFWNITRVNQFYMASYLDEPWLMDDVEILGTQTPWINSSSAIQTVYRNGVPHTNKNGVTQSTYSPSTSFLPIGVFHMWVGTAYRQTWTFSTIANAGYNSCFMWAGQRPTLVIADAARNAGVQIITQFPTDSEVSAFKDHPAILGWFIEEEPTCHYWQTDPNPYYQAFLTRRSQIKAIDPTHPVFAVDCNWTTDPVATWWRTWNAAGDVSCHDNYQITEPNSSLKAVGTTVNLAATINNQSKPMWFCVQAHTCFDGAGNLIQPTTMQERCTVYSAIIHGATGIFYFGLDSYTMRSSMCVGIAPSPLTGYGGGTPVATAAQVAQSKALWNAIANINSELNALRPVILSPTANEPYELYLDSSMTGSLLSPIRTILKRNPDGGYILFLSNLESNPQNVKIRFPNRNYTITELYGTAGFTKDGDSFLMSCPGYDVRIFKILPPTVAQVKLLPDSAASVVTYGVVSAVFSDCFYMESSERTGGIRVNAPTSDIAVGQIVNVTGTLSTTASKERCINATAVN